jgi:hypothetical protein
MNYNFEKEILEMVKFDNTVYSEHIKNFIDSIDEISKHQQMYLNYDFILDYYEL